MKAHKLTPEQELQFLCEIHGKDSHARLFGILTESLNVLQVRSQLLLSLVAICLTITGFSGATIAATDLLSKISIGIGLAFVLLSAVVVMIGPLQVQWATQTRAESIDQSLIQLIERRNARTRCYHLASLFLILGLAGYVASVIEYLFKS